jgi:hypothetical protein
LRIACTKYKQCTKQFLRELNDSEIDKALGKMDDDSNDDSLSPMKRSERDKHKEDDMVMIPKADGNPGIEGGGWD